MTEIPSGLKFAWALNMTCKPYVGKNVGFRTKTNKGNLDKLETLLLGRNKIKVLEKGL